eukprot:337905-Prorocentrum_minimum.AAC.1
MLDNVRNYESKPVDMCRRKGRPSGRSDFWQPAKARPLFERFPSLCKKTVPRILGNLSKP